MAIKRLLRQTLSHDDELIDVHPLASLILSEGVRLGAGSSVKTDGEESDPWGLIAAVDVHQCKVGQAYHFLESHTNVQDDPGFKPFLDYLMSSLPKQSPIRPLLGPSSPPASSSRPALIFSLRMLNLPLPLMPPLYKMLLSELDAKQPGREQVPGFTHALIWGRGYRLEGGQEAMGLDINQGENK